jgi:diadenosine tetraphosphate (Ap4A) HIT family hydrolase
MCAEGRPEVTDDGVRFYAGKVADGYLRRSGIQRGLTVVIWRGRHVAEPTDLSDSEADEYWHELLTVGRALATVMQPVKLNYSILGNSVPHLHTHIVPRYADDPRPGWPFPFPAEEPPPMLPDALESDVDDLREALRVQKTAGGIHT